MCFVKSHLDRLDSQCGNNVCMYRLSLKGKWPKGFQKFFCKWTVQSWKISCLLGKWISPSWELSQGAEWPKSSTVPHQLRESWDVCLVYPHIPSAEGRGWYTVRTEWIVVNFRKKNKLRTKKYTEEKLKVCTVRKECKNVIVKSVYNP